MSNIKVKNKMKKIEKFMDLIREEREVARLDEYMAGSPEDSVFYVGFLNSVDNIMEFLRKTVLHNIEETEFPDDYMEGIMEAMENIISFWEGLKEE